MYHERRHINRESCILQTWPAILWIGILHSPAPIVERIANVCQDPFCDLLARLCYHVEQLQGRHSIDQVEALDAKQEFLISFLCRQAEPKVWCLDVLLNKVLCLTKANRLGARGEGDSTWSSSFCWPYKSLRKPFLLPLKHIYRRMRPKRGHWPLMELVFTEAVAWRGFNNHCRCTPFFIRLEPFGMGCLWSSYFQYICNTWSTSKSISRAVSSLALHVVISGNSYRSI